MSFASNGSQSSQSHLISLNDFLSTGDDRYFTWNDDNREMSEAWLTPVWDAKLEPRKHKVFNHCSKEYLQPPSPFVQYGPELGDSGSTIVYKVTPPEGYAYRRPLALKVIVCKENSRPPGPDSTARSNALKEVKVMSDLRHPHIVAYVASFEDYCLQSREIKRRPHGKAHAASMIRVNERIKKHILAIAMYPPAMCNLRTLMEEVFLNPQEAQWILQHLHSYFGCLSQAVAYLHSHKPKVKHKDIKPENVVIDDFWVPILTDFGLSKHFETGQHSEGPTPKTIKYAAPEAIQEGERDQHSDIFSLGCVFLEMATVLLGKPPSFAESQLSTRPSTTPFSPGHEFKYSESLHNLDTYLTTLSQLAHNLMNPTPTPTPSPTTLTTSFSSTATGSSSTTATIPSETTAASAKAVLAILPYIRRMMDPNPALRPEASQLYPWFRHLYDIYDQPGACLNCEEERRTGKAILPPRGGSGRVSPTLNRSGTMNFGNGHGGGGHSANGGGGGGAIVRRATAGSVIGVGTGSQPSRVGGGGVGWGPQSSQPVDGGEEVGLL
ncbi:hypothetical protein VTI74DRAFT_5491 [Chaetomium olivicolor]